MNISFESLSSENIDFSNRDNEGLGYRKRIRVRQKSLLSRLTRSRKRWRRRRRMHGWLTVVSPLSRFLTLTQTQTHTDDADAVRAHGWPALRPISCFLKRMYVSFILKQRYDSVFLSQGSILELLISRERVLGVLAQPSFLL